MKKLILLIATATLFQSCYTMKYKDIQIPPITDQIEVSSSKNELFVKANNWMVENFVDAKSVLQFSDKESGTVTGKYLMQPGYAATYGVPNIPEVYAIIKIQVKDGAAKITVDPSDFKTVDTINKTRREMYYNESKAEEKVNQLITSFKNYMKSPTESF